MFFVRKCGAFSRRADWNDATRAGFDLKFDLFFQPAVVDLPSGKGCDDGNGQSGKLGTLTLGHGISQKVGSIAKDGNASTANIESVATF